MTPLPRVINKQGFPRTFCVRGLIPRLAPTWQEWVFIPHHLSWSFPATKSKCGHYYSYQREHPALESFLEDNTHRMVPELLNPMQSGARHPNAKQLRPSRTLRSESFVIVTCQVSVSARGHFVIGPVDLPVHPSCSSATRERARPQEPWSHCAGYSLVCTKQITDLKPPPQTTLSEGSQASTVKHKRKLLQSSL